MPKSTVPFTILRCCRCESLLKTGPFKDLGLHKKSDQEPDGKRAPEIMCEDGGDWDHHRFFVSRYITVMVSFWSCIVHIYTIKGEEGKTSHQIYEYKGVC